VVNRLLSIAFAGVCCAFVLAGCGASGKASAAAPGQDPELAFSRCMRAHGVTNFPDPTGHGGLTIRPGAGIDPQSPAFQAAQKACQNIVPDGGGPPKMTASQRAAALRFAECMRANGVPSFPDPALDASGAKRVLVVRGMVFALTAQVDPQSPAFRQAAPRCGVHPPPGPGPQAQ
jgi:hypothetical protein